MFTSTVDFRAGASFARVCQQAKQRVLARCLVFLTFIFVAATASAQQFEFVNPSFEEFAPGYNPDVNYRITSPSNVVGWNSVRTSNGTPNQIEHWRDGFLGVPAQNGRYFIELNPSVPVFLYQGHLDF